jgi:hypothetical protein
MNLSDLTRKFGGTVTGIIETQSRMSLWKVFMRELLGFGIFLPQLMPM